MRHFHYLSLFAAVTVGAACGGNARPEQPVPQDVPEAGARANQDSIDAENRRRADEEARQREEERRRREGETAAGGGADAAGGLMSDLTSMIHFDYDQAEVRANDQAVLDRKAAILQANPGLQIRISGHADERGSDEYNLALGNRRAAAAKRYLQNQGVSASRIDVVSYGEERPLAQALDETAYAENRRAEFEITSGGTNLRAPQ